MVAVSNRQSLGTGAQAASLSCVSSHGQGFKGMGLLTALGTCQEGEAVCRLLALLAHEVLCRVKVGLPLLGRTRDHDRVA